MCDGFSDSEVLMDPFSVAVGGTVQLHAYGTYADGSVDNFTGSSSWSSDATSVATVGASTGLVTGVSAGSVSISAQFPSLVVYTGEICTEGCPVPCPTGILGGGSSGSVLAPYAAVVLNTILQGAASCPSGSAGWSRTVTLQLQNQSGQPIPISGILMADVISVQTPNPLGVSSANVASASTSSSGTWPDTYYVCSTACPGSTGQADAIQTWTWNGIPLPHSNVIVYECSSITVDGR